jgi:hypothetical protein
MLPASHGDNPFPTKRMRISGGNFIPVLDCEFTAISGLLNLFVRKPDFFSSANEPMAQTQVRACSNSALTPFRVGGIALQAREVHSNGAARLGAAENEP